MSTRFTRFFLFLLLTFGLGILSAPAGTSTRTDSRPRVRVESSTGMTIENVRLRARPNGWLVSGLVERGFGRPALPGDHLRVEVRKANGALFSRKRLHLAPSGHPRVLGAWIGRSTFADTVSIPPHTTLTLSTHSGPHHPGHLPAGEKSRTPPD